MEKNYKFSEEHRRRIALSHIGKKHSEETKNKISNFFKGKTYEQLYGKEKAKEKSIKQSSSMKGKNTGKKRSDEFKEKLRKSNLGRKYSSEVNLKKGRPSKRKGISKYDRTLMIYCKCGCGKLRKKYDKKGRDKLFIKGHQGYASWESKSQEEKERIADRMRNLAKGRISSKKDKKFEEFYGIERAKKIKLKIKSARSKQITPMKDTKIELKIQNFLKQLGIEYFTHQYMKEIEHGYQCDILIPSMNLVIECDGNYWHKYPIGNELDHIRTKELLEKGFKILRLWEFEIKDMDLDGFKEKLG